MITIEEQEKRVLRTKMYGMLTEAHWTSGDFDEFLFLFMSLHPDVFTLKSITIELMEEYFYAFFKIDLYKGDIKSIHLELIRRAILINVINKDYGPTAEELEDCIDDIITRCKKIRGVATKEIIKYYYRDIESYFYNAIRIIHEEK